MSRFFLLICLFLVHNALQAQNILPNATTAKAYQLAPVSADLTEAHRISLTDAGSDASKMSEALGNSLENVLRLTSNLTTERAELVEKEGKGVQLKISYTLGTSEKYTVLMPVFKLNGFYQIEEQFNARSCRTQSCDQEVQFEATSCSCGGEAGELNLLNSSM
ncbi:MAG: hypothetical protein AB8F78_02505 [Saprospiraceae bacterium]